MAEWFGKMVEERRKQYDCTREEKLVSNAYRKEG